MKSEIIENKNSFQNTFCSYCDTKLDYNETLIGIICSQCKQAVYCSHNCEIKDFKFHKVRCFFKSFN